MIQKKLLIWVICLITGISGAVAQDVSFTASAPNAVVVGQQFRLSYSLSNADGTELRIPDLPDFEILMGPMNSQSMSTQIINGQRSTQRETTYTYTLMAKKEGTFNIPEATIKVKNGQYKSNALTVKVLPQDSQPATSGNNASSGGQSISSTDIFVRMIVSKQSMYENEGFIVTFKLYTRVDISSVDPPQYPNFEGFIAYDIDLPQDRQLSLENYNGQNYRTLVLKQSVLFPQRTGNITIGSGKFDFTLQVRSRQPIRSIFDDFFDSYTTVVKPVTSAAQTINVKPLPEGKPASFSGAVGDYKITSSINTEKLKSNESVTVKIVISGNGNIKMVKHPEIKYPNSFEIYDPKIDVNDKIGAGGVSGSKTIEYLAIPRYAGDFTIPANEFSYFDPKSGTYKTLKTNEYHLQVEKGNESETGTSPIFVGNTNREELKFLGKDIRYIKTEGFSFSAKGDFFFGSLWYWLWYIIPSTLFIVFFIIYRKQVKENANIALVRTKRASKVASKRLKSANKLLKENKKEAFYDELLKALWGYLSDKLSIPVAQLTKENVETEMRNFGAGEDLINEFKNVLNTCEFARFAPISDEGGMDKLYESAVKSIDKMENTIKK